MADTPTASRGEFLFTAEQQELRAAVRRFCAQHFDEATIAAALGTTRDADAAERRQ